MISLLPIIELLKNKPAQFGAGTDLRWFTQVEGAEAFARRKMQDVPLPACFVVREFDRAQAAGELLEDETLGFKVILGVTNERRHASLDTDEMLLRYRRAIAKQLEGAVLAGFVDGTLEGEPTRPIRFTGGAVVETTDRDHWWADSFVFSARLSNYLSDPAAFEAVQHSTLVTLAGGLTPIFNTTSPTGGTL